MYINTFQCKVDQAGNGNGPLTIMEPLPCGPRRDHRPHTAVRCFFGSLYLSTDHRQRMEDLRRRMGYRRGRDTPAYYAAMYLLTSNESLYRHTANCFCRYGIEFAYATLREMPPHDYTLFSAAKDIYTDTPGTAVADLANVVVVDTLAFSLIVNALLIARYGRAVLNTKEKETPF